MGVIRQRVWVVVFTNDAFMLAQRSNTVGNPLTWNFFGGNIDSGETIYTAAVRELKEESGLSGKPVFLTSLLLKGSKHYFYGLQVPTEVEPKFNREHIDYAWLSFDKPVTYKLHGPTKLFIKRGGLAILRDGYKFPTRSILATTVERITTYIKEAKGGVMSQALDRIRHYLTQADFGRRVIDGKTPTPAVKTPTTLARESVHCFIINSSTGRLLLVKAPGGWTTVSSLRTGSDPLPKVVEDILSTKLQHTRGADTTNINTLTNSKGFSVHNVAVVVNANETKVTGYDDSKWVDWGKWPAPLHEDFVAVITSSVGVSLIKRIINTIINKPVYAAVRVLFPVLSKYIDLPDTVVADIVVDGSYIKIEMSDKSKQQLNAWLAKQLPENARFNGNLEKDAHITIYKSPHKLGTLGTRALAQPITIPLKSFIFGKHGMGSNLHGVIALVNDKSVNALRNKYIADERLISNTSSALNTEAHMSLIKNIARDEDRDALALALTDAAKKSNLELVYDKVTVVNMRLNMPDSAKIKVEAPVKPIDPRRFLPSPRGQQRPTTKR